MFGLFGKNRKSKEVWRDAEGKIHCPQPLCEQGCTDKCPIHLNREAEKLMQKRKYTDALAALNRALSITSDFPELYKNQATCRDLMGRHKEASFANRQYCTLSGTEYRKLPDPGIVTFVKEQAEENVQPEVKKDEPQETKEEVKELRFRLHDEVLRRLILNLKENAGVSESDLDALDPIFEEMSGAVSKDVYNAILELYRHSRGMEAYNTALTWSAYAGIAVAALFFNGNIDRSNMHEAYRMITFEHGLEVLDEYSLFLDGREFGTDAGAVLLGQIRAAAKSAFTEAVRCSKDAFSIQMNECLKAMFLYGAMLETRNTKERGIEV